MRILKALKWQCFHLFYTLLWSWYLGTDRLGLLTGLDPDNNCTLSMPESGSIIEASSYLIACFCTAWLYACTSVFSLDSELLWDAFNLFKDERDPRTSTMRPLSFSLVSLSCIQTLQKNVMLGPFQLFIGPYIQDLMKALLEVETPALAQTSALASIL